MTTDNTDSFFPEEGVKTLHPAVEAACRGACLVDAEQDEVPLGIEDSYPGSGIILPWHSDSQSQSVALEWTHSRIEAWSQWIDEEGPQEGYRLVGRDEPSSSSAEPVRSLRDILDRFRRLPGITFATQLANRLHTLLELAQEERPEQAPPAAESLETFLSFLIRHRHLKRPSVVLTPEGDIRAMWRGDEKARVTLEFLDDANVRFVIFAPDPQHQYKTIRAAGAATIDSVLELAAPYGVLNWLQDPAN